jgi:hypothetical protein
VEEVAYVVNVIWEMKQKTSNVMPTGGGETPLEGGGGRGAVPVPLPSQAFRDEIKARKPQGVKLPAGITPGVDDNDDLMRPYERPNLAKWDAAMYALHSEMGPERGWKEVCWAGGNISREFELKCPNEPPITEDVWQIVEKHSRLSSPEKFASGEYTSEENRTYFEAVYNGYEKRKAEGKKCIGFGGIIEKAKNAGWDEAKWDAEHTPTGGGVTPGVLAEPFLAQAATARSA